MTASQTRLPHVPHAARIPSLDQHRTLILNRDNRPLGFPVLMLNWQDTARALFLDRIEMVTSSSLYIRAPSCEVELPSVARLRDYVEPYSLQERAAFTSYNQFVRDRGLCQYTGEALRYRTDDQTTQFTLDHVIPTSRGGGNDWTNCVVASHAINNFKADLTPEEAGLTLATPPWEPNGQDLLSLWLSTLNLQQIDPSWLEFLTPIRPTDRVKKLLDACPLAA